MSVSGPLPSGLTRTSIRTRFLAPNALISGCHRWKVSREAYRGMRWSGTCTHLVAEVDGLEGEHVHLGRCLTADELQHQPVLC